jgi:uncharacterized protein DUF4175
MHDAIVRSLFELRQGLRVIRRQTLAELTFQGCVVGITALLLAVLGLYGAARLGIPPLAGLGAAVFCGAAWGWAILDLPAARNSLFRNALVLEVERSNGLERGALLSPLQIAESHCSGRPAGAETLVHGAINEAVRLAAQLPRRLPVRRSRLTLAGFVTTGAAVAILCGADGPGVMAALERLGSTHDAPLAFRLWTDRSVVARGETVQVFVRRLAPLQEPLYLSSTEEIGPEARWESRLVSESIPEKLRFQDQPLYGMHLGPLSATRRFFVSSGSLGSAIREVRVADRPRLVRFTTEITLPAYLGQAPIREERTDGNLTVPWGSRVRLTVLSDQPIVSGRLLLGAEHKPLPMMVQGPSEARVDLEVTEPRFYEIEVVGASSLTNLPVRYDIKPLEDQTPTVRILKPGRDLTVDKDQSITLDIAAEDDHRIDRMELMVSVDQGPEQAIPLTVEPAAKLRLEHPWDLGSLGLSFEQEVSYYVAAWDNDTLRGPKRGVSATYKLRYPSFYEIYQQAEKQQNKEIESVTGLAEKQKEIVEELDRMASKLEPDQSLDWKQSEQLRGIQQRQEQLKSEVQNMAKELRDKAEQLQKDSLATSELINKMNEVSKLFEQLADEDMQHILDQIRETLEKLQLTPEQLAEMQKNMNSEQLLQGLDRTLDLLRRLEAERQLEALSELAKKLGEQQDKLADATQSLLQPPSGTPTPSPEGASPQAGPTPPAQPQDAQGSKPGETQPGDQSQKPAESGQKPPSPQELAEQQRQLSPEMQALEDKLSKLPESEALQPLAQDLDRLRQELGDPSSEADQAGEQLQRQQLDAASKIQRPLGRRLQSLAQQLGQMAERMRGMELGEILAIIDGLVHELADVTVRLDDLRQRALVLADLSRFSILSTSDRDHISSVARDLELGHQASKAILAQIVELGSKSPQLSKDVAGKVEAATEKLQEAQDSIENLSMGTAATGFLDARVQLHEAAVALLSLTEALSQGIPSAGQSLRESLEQLSEDQRRLAEAMRQGQNGQGLLPVPMPRSMEQMAAEQARIRRQLEQIQKQYEAMQGSMGSLEGLEDDMKDLEKHYQQGALTPEAEQKQKKILDKLLEAQQALRERKIDPERESRSAKAQPPAESAPSKMVEDPWEKQLHGLLDDPEADISPEDRQILERYYLRLAEDQP